MGAFTNTLAQRNREVKQAVDTQSFTYGYEVWVPQDGVHAAAATSANAGGELPWPGGPQVPNYPGDTPLYTATLHRGQATLLFRIEEDAHFRIDAVTASVYGLVKWDTTKNFQQQSGAKFVTGLTRYPFPGDTDGFAERGVSVKVSDLSKDTRELMSDYTPMEILFPPGYGVHIAEPYLYGYVLEKRHTLRLDFQNRDFTSTAGQDNFHVVKIAFTGRKFYTD
jgi:hypothetical protein